MHSRIVIARPQGGRGNLAVPGGITGKPGENATAFPRLHPKGTSSRFALRAPRQGSASCISALLLQHPVEKIKNRHQSGFFRSNFSFSVAFAEKIRYDGR